MQPAERRARTSARSSSARSSVIACSTPSSWRPADPPVSNLTLAMPSSRATGPLGDVDVLDAVERNRAVGSVDDPAVDADLVAADTKRETLPIEEQADKQSRRAARRRRSSAVCQLPVAAR